MEYYAAPMEGITGYIWRNAHHHFYPGIHKYFTPFLSPKMKKGMNSKERNDVLREHNQGIHLVPQVLTNKAEEMVHMTGRMQELGYDEMNLNLGCPSATVVSKEKGCGFLRDRDRLRHFFEDTMNGLEQRGLSDMKLSVKTRLGLDDPDEILSLMEIYNDYPLSEVIIHARIHKDFYKKPVKWDAFRQALSMSRHPICYNGDLFSMEDVRTFAQEFPQVERVMLGRGLIANPEFLEQDGRRLKDYPRFFAFHEEVVRGYQQIMSGDRNVLFKMKELWSYMEINFPGQDKVFKKIKKSNHLMEYMSAVSSLSYEMI